MELKEAIHSRRSVRVFKKDEILHEDLMAIIEDAVMAPSGTNMQPWYFVVLETKEARNRYKKFMTATAENFKEMLSARFKDNPEVVKATFDYFIDCGGAPVIILVFLHKPELNAQSQEHTHTQSVAAAIENLLLSAWGRGIGSCWMTAPAISGLAEEIRAEFAPTRGSFVAAIALGYPEIIGKAPKRKEDRYEFI